MNLRQTQELFWRAISWPTGIDDFLAKADEDTRRAFVETFARTDAFGRNERVQVYADAYFWRLFEVMVEQYEVTAWLMGSRHFHNFITDYVLANPSQNPDIRKFGDRLPQFLSDHAEAQRIEGIEDVAAVELAIMGSIDAPNDDALPPTQLGEVPVQRWPGLRFELTRSSHVIRCRLPFPELWRSFSAKEDAPTDLRPAEGTLVVWREGHEVFQRACSPAEGRALQALARGQTFEQICDVASGPLTTDATAQDVVVWLQQWLSGGLIRRFRLD